MSKYLKILILCPIDLGLVGGCLPALWQLFQRLAELGHELIIVPTKGRAYRTLWWNFYPNPISKYSLYNMLTGINDKLSRATVSKINNQNINAEREQKQIPRAPKLHYYFNVLKEYNDHFHSSTRARPWKKRLLQIFQNEKEIDVVYDFSDSGKHMKWLPKYIHSHFGVPVILYSADFATYLWDQSSFRVSPYYNIDFREYDAYIITSQGAVNKLKEKGAQNIHVLHFGADPSLFSPIKVKKEIDISFYGYNAKYRKDAMKSMITQPSNLMKNIKFQTAGNFTIDLGNSKAAGPLNFFMLKSFICKSKINLNITKKTFAETYATSTARIFELAAMESCIVSNPCKGMEEWFTPGKELFVVNDEAEAVEIYNWLLSSEEERYKMGKNARQKVCKKHTYKHRAAELQKITRTICSKL